MTQCHARGQKVIVDGVFNHVGRDFFAFQDLKANRENARYKDWFCDVNFWGNNEYNDGFSYGNWGGFNLLVKLNQRNPEVQNYHYRYHPLLGGRVRHRRHSPGCGRRAGL